MNPRPIGTRKTVQLMVILTILAWATQTLFHQWGLGGLILPVGGRSTESVAATAVTIEVRDRITAGEGKVTVRDVCRWSEQDAPVLNPVAEIVITRLGAKDGAHQIGIDQIKNTLHDAGMNLATLRFSGAASCAVVVEGQAASGGAKPLASASDSTTQPSQDAPEPIVADAPQTPLKDLLVKDLSDRLSIPADRLKVDFSERDEAVLALTSPRCSFDFHADSNGLGTINWNVSIMTDTSDRPVTISAKALALEDQLVLTRPLSRGQAVLYRDVAPFLALVDKLHAAPLTAPEQVLGQVLARDVKTGDVLTAGDIKSPPIVTAGEFITVELKVQNMDVETVARAIDSGAKGEIVRAKNEATGDVYRVVINGPSSATQVTSQGAL